jgi:hypothetical protein
MYPLKISYKKNKVPNNEEEEREALEEDFL